MAFPSGWEKVVVDSPVECIDRIAEWAQPWQSEGAARPESIGVSVVDGKLIFRARVGELHCGQAVDGFQLDQAVEPSALLESVQDAVMHALGC